MFTLAEAEKRHEKLMSDLRKLRRAMRTSQDVEGIADQITKLKMETASLYGAIKKHQLMAAWLSQTDCYGGIH